MKRWLTRIIFCLVLGAITTVAVAWGVAVHEARTFRRISADRGSAWIGIFDRLMPTDARLYNRTRSFQEFGWRSNELPDVARRALADKGFAFGGAECSGLELQYGWSAPALCYRQVLWAFPPGWTGEPGDPARAVWICERVSGIDISWLVASDQHRDRTILPYRPIALGVAIDVSLYAFVWAGPLIIFPGARGWYRRRRGRCASCGYLLKRLPSDRCPECGAEV